MQALVQNAGVDKGSVEVDIRENETQSSDDNNNINCKRKKDLANDESMFNKLKNSISARSNLSAIHAARSYKYGHV